MVRPAVFCLLSLLLPLFWSCSETPTSTEKKTAQAPWNDRQEEIHQLQELIRYEDETARQRQAELEALALPVDSSAAEPVMPAGEGQGQAEQ